MLRLRNEVENFLDKLSNNFDDRKSRITFLINNYDQIMTVLNVRFNNNSNDFGIIYKVLKYVIFIGNWWKNCRIRNEPFQRIIEWTNIGIC